MRATTEPMRTNRPRAKRRSRNATNMVCAFPATGFGDYSTLAFHQILGIGHPNTVSRLECVRTRRTFERLPRPGRRRRIQPMAHTTLTPVFVGLRTGLHVLFIALIGLVIARAILAPTDASVTVIVLSVTLGLTYALGAVMTRTTRARGLLRLGWLTVLTGEWVVLLWLIPDAAYLVFPLFFLYLHLLGRWWGAAAILESTLVAICALGLHSGWTVGGVVGPLVGAGVALLIGLGYQALAREAEQREALVRELIATQGQLAATEHESGVLAERARLAREIHDTLAQGLSSIQMLLHAARSFDPRHFHPRSKLV